MTNSPYNQADITMDAGIPAGIDTFDLTPQGLADAPAHEEDFDSIVHTGNS
ncbi:hypothetical protein [Pseudarthrobacter sp. NamE2]|uniref:hypothetical protein n=1 Tax=Pseudarthrobacter sp. NamE2 TaxID=2576838 RepID=UPI0014859C38|nr:hypothetical protein [Pseudarthrobacter sp. NamE2]